MVLVIVSASTSTKSAHMLALHNIFRSCILCICRVIEEDAGHN